MLPLVLAAIGAVAPPPGSVGLAATVQTSAQARTGHYDDGNELARVETMVEPRLSLLRTGELQLAASYAPSLVVPWDLGSSEAALSQNPAAEAISHHFLLGALYGPGRWQWHAVGNLSLGDTFFYGLNPTTPAAATGGQQGSGDGGGANPPPVRQAVATTERIAHLAADVDLGTTATLPAGTFLSLGVGASQTGATDEAAKALLPTVRGVRAQAGLQRRVAPRHLLGVEIFGDRSRVGSDRDLAYVRGGFTWDHELGRRSGLQLGTGLAWTWERENAAEPSPTGGTDPVLPWIEGSYSFTQTGQRPSFSTGLRLEPAVDRYRAAIDLQGTAYGSVSWEPWRDWSLGFHGSTSTSVEPRGGWTDPHTSVHSLSLHLSRNFGPVVYAGLSAGVVWQLTDRADLPGFREELVTLDLGARIFAL